MELRTVGLSIAAGVVSLCVSGLLCVWLGSQHAYGAHTDAQRTLAVGFCLLIALWAAAEVEHRVSVPQAKYSAVAADNSPGAIGVVKLGRSTVEDGAQVESEPVGKAEATTVHETAHAHHRGETANASKGDKKATAASGGNKGALGRGLKPLRACAELAALFALIYVCDRTDLIPKGKKKYDPAHFWTVWALVCVVALYTTRTLETSMPLQRQQTDEWKGWMQLMFLMYHYFAESEVYNAIRVYIAAYVWMTGFGNFLLYQKGKAFTARRTLQMLFRLNFLGALICFALNNEYLLYYICAMHTFFTIIVALVMFINQEANLSFKGVHLKILACFVIVVVVYDSTPAIFHAIFGNPLVHDLFAFHDPLHPENSGDDLHEWYFRSGLDRFIWVIGMLQAYYVAKFVTFITWIEDVPNVGKRVSLRAAVVLSALAPSVVWWYFVFRKSKYAYNGVHPYTSWVPISAFLVLRNAFPELRQRYLWLFAYLGKFTLETYIFQFHIWMKTTGLNGSPKYLMDIVPGWYWLNMAITTPVYMFLSVRMFHITTTIRDALIPEGIVETGKRWGLVVVGCVVCWFIGKFLRESI